LWAPVYWYEHALQVIDAVRARGYNVRLALAASSASPNERYRETIRATCRNIAWVDVLEDVALQDLFPQVCCVLRTTRADSFGLVVAEALWQGIPAVATNVCSRPAGALTFSPGDTQGAVAAVIGVLQDPGAAAEAALRSVVPSGTEELTHLYRSLATR
jgi:glycosyltransferase involved in cell wall biosynthesis